MGEFFRTCVINLITVTGASPSAFDARFYDTLQLELEVSMIVMKQLSNYELYFDDVKCHFLLEGFIKLAFDYVLSSIGIRLCFLRQEQIFVGT